MTPTPENDQETAEQITADTHDDVPDESEGVDQTQTPYEESPS